MEQFMKLMRDEHRIFTDTDDEKMLTLLETTHAHASLVVDVQPLLELIQDILNLSTTTTTATNISPTGQPVCHAMESLKNKISSAATFEGLARDIHNISCKVS
ncbi:uncharacterized protein LOC122076086 [Macadamia integrifolia]|uniref:uncharacterized protein LOC122076086 n=1 Tax=Macadamia integrifolia TaxID=60698 RepID=UPI001C4F9217|nr:uncharacterized protein LOC122076086 [Macadamia integrifolia]